MRSSEERIAVLEEKTGVMKIGLEDLAETLEETNTRLDSIDQRLAKQQGFWAGVTFLAAIVGVALRAMWDWLQSHI